MKVDEIGRVCELVRDLQAYQKMVNIPRLPTSGDLLQELIHEREGVSIPNRFGTYTVVAIDTDKPRDESKAHVVGYLIYSQSFSILKGRHFYMNSFFISADYRRHGLGRKFMEFLKIHGSLTGNDILDVPYMNNNVIGQKFYSTFGSTSVNEEYILRGKKLDMNANKLIN